MIIQILEAIKFGILNTVSNTAEISTSNGDTLEIAETNIESNEKLTLKLDTTISTSGSVNNAGTLTLDGATLNTSSANLNLGTVRSVCRGARSMSPRVRLQLLSVDH